MSSHCQLSKELQSTPKLHFSANKLLILEEVAQISADSKNKAPGFELSSNLHHHIQIWILYESFQGMVWKYFKNGSDKSYLMVLSFVLRRKTEK